MLKLPINYFYIYSIAVLISLILIFFLRKISLRYNFLESKGVPVLGGVGFGAAFFFACLSGLNSYGLLSKQVFGFVIASFLMFFFGLMDDLFELSITKKFCMQLIASFILIISGIRSDIVYLGPFLNGLITIIWVIGITNAFNHLDVLDGLSGSVAALAGIGLFFIALLNHDFVSAIISLSLTGAVFGFLAFNLPPARTYMGNSGSHFIGFILSVTALFISYAPANRKLALLSPILILGFPVIDTTILVLLRISRRILPFRKSDDHPALKLLALGYSKEKALLTMLLWSLLFVISGVIASQASNVIILIIILSVSLVSFILFKKVCRAKVHA